MNQTDIALLALMAVSLPLLGLGFMIIKWQIALEAAERSPAKPDIKPAE